MLTSFNIVDGIYAEQVGLLILPTDVRAIPAAGDPFTALDPSGLLAQISTFRQNTPAVLNAGIAHLLSGKDLDGDVIGIARLSGVCSARDGVSLSEGGRGSSRAGLIMAHEIGHNLGAEHDGEPGVCAAAPTGYLMDPFYNGSATFTPCSLDSMHAVIATAQCITPAMYGDVELPAAVPTPQVQNDTPIVLPFAVRSAGTVAAQAARLTVTAPADFSITATSMPASCTLAGNTATCELGDIPAGESRTVNVTLLPAVVGHYLVEARVTASNNRYTNNDRQTQPVQVIANADASVTMTATATSLFTGDAVDYTIAVTSLRSHASPNTTVYFDYQQYHVLHVESATTTGGTCTIVSDQVQCSLGNVIPGTTRTIRIRARGFSVGSTRMLASVRSDVDGDSDNNLALVDIEVKAVHDVGVEDVTQPGLFQLGMPFEIKANLRSTGIQSVGDVRVQISVSADPAVQNAISSVTVGGAPCARAGPGLYQCTVGTMAAGEVRQISLRANAAALGPVTFWAQSYAATQDNSSNDFHDRTFSIVYGLDAEVSAGSGTGGLEGAELSGGFYVTSNGLFPSNNAVVVAELPPEVRFTRFTIGTPATTDCAITDPQHLRCTFNVPQQHFIHQVSYYLTSDVPGNYQVTETLTLAGDENPANDSAQSSIIIGSIVDVSVSQFTMGNYLYVGQNQTVPLTVLTGARPAEDVRVTVSTAPAGQLASLSTDTGSCTRDGAQLFNCTLGDLPGNATVNMTAVVTTDSVPSYPFGQLTVRAETPRDFNLSNNSRSWLFQTALGADASVSVGAASVTGTAGTRVTLPTITVRHSGSLTNGRLELAFPAGMAVASLSGTLTQCSGTIVVRCFLPSVWDENQELTLIATLDVPTATTFNAVVTASASNDFNVANDQASIAVTVNAPAAPPPPNNGGGGSNAGGGGGGGRLEWFAVALLAMLAMRRVSGRRQRWRLS